MDRELIAEIIHEEPVCICALENRRSQSNSTHTFRFFYKVQELEEPTCYERNHYCCRLWK